MGRLGHGAKSIVGTPMSPPLNVREIDQYLEDIQEFVAISDLLEVVGHRVVVDIRPYKTDLTKFLAHYNNRGFSYINTPGNGKHVKLRVWVPSFQVRSVY